MFLQEENKGGGKILSKNKRREVLQWFQMDSL